MDFFGTTEEGLMLLRQIMALNYYTIILNRDYPEPEPIVLDVLDSRMIEMLAEHPLLHLYSQEFSLYKPLMEKYPSGYVINDRQSGPAIQLMLPISRILPNGLIDVGGGIHHYLPYYCKPGTFETYSPPAAIKRAYARLKHLIRKQCVRCDVDLRVPNPEIPPFTTDFWIFTGSMDLINQEKACICFGPNLVTKKDLRPRTSPGRSLN